MKHSTKTLLAHLIYYGVDVLTFGSAVALILAALVYCFWYHTSITLATILSAFVVIGVLTVYTWAETIVKDGSRDR